MKILGRFYATNKHAKIITIISIAFIVCIFSLVFLISAVRSFVTLIIPPTSWLDAEANSTVYIQYTNHDGTLAGQLQDTSNNNNQVQSYNAAFTGYLNGSQISLTFSSFLTNVTLTGTVQGDTMTLVH